MLLVSAKLVLCSNKDLLVIFPLIYLSKDVYGNFVSVKYSYQQISTYCKRCQNIRTVVYLPFTIDTCSSSLFECLSKYQVTYTYLQSNYNWFRSFNVLPIMASILYYRFIAWNYVSSSWLFKISNFTIKSIFIIFGFIK